ncbi:hypothetical protein PoB_002284200 [Plakobranchus ocellatus]|uniref:HEAT repeat-containing protein 1 n=1 Tax=Plakobranchus ocellatus TaxID=259542 RepID=A0AAV3ZP94_9GAST|nr:hypothetical protein PoB_002284200 [Plakobranchus ocellatus]
MLSSVVCWDPVPKLFSRILLFWKEAPTCNNWAMEKLMELFCKHIAPDPALVQSTGFTSFVERFFESGSLIQYPDFVMNNVALMAGEVLLSGSFEQHDIEELGLRLIRYPLEYWLVDKGHCANVSFQLFSKFVKRRVLLTKLDSFSFDVSQAVAYAIASPQNYARKSASIYFSDLLKFAFQTSNQEPELQTMKEKLRKAIFECLKKTSFSQHQSGNNGSVSKLFSHVIDRDVKLRFCLLICDSMRACYKLFDMVRSEDFLTDILELCCEVAQTEMEDGGGLYSMCVHILVTHLPGNFVLDNWQTHHSVLLKMMLILCKQGSIFTITEVMHMSHLLLLGFGAGEVTDRALMMELSLLPLFALVSASLPSVQRFCPGVITTVKQALSDSSISKALPMVKAAVDHLYSILDVKVSCNQQVAELLNYLSFQQKDLPSEVEKCLFSGMQPRDGQVVGFLEYSFLHIENSAHQKHYKNENLETVIECFMNHPRLSYKQIRAAMKCYIQITNARGHSSKVLLSLLQTLQFKMVDLDQNIQEIAVKSAGDLLLIDGLDFSSQVISTCAKALWQCVDYKAEGVATQVMDFLLTAVMNDKLDTLLPELGTTKAGIVSKAEQLLVTSSWDNIRPLVFKLLSQLCPDETVFRYAQASLKRYCVPLQAAVFDYVKTIFEKNYSSFSVGQSVENVMRLLSTGWGDLLLDQRNSIETCSFRQVSSVMENLLAFMQKEDVSNHMEMLVKDIVTKKTLADSQCNGFDTFSHLCNNLMHLHGHHVPKEFWRSSQKYVIEHMGDAQRDKKNIGKKEITGCVSGTLDEEGEIPAKKCKYDTEVCEIFENCSSLSANTKSFLNYVFATTQVSSSVLLEVPEQAHYESANVLEDDNVDSTKELPPLVPSNEPSSLKKLLFKYVTCEDSNEFKQISNIVSWLVHKEILQRIHPESLCMEAQRSTDEYERNCLMLLHDFDQLLNKSYHNMKEELEKQIISFLLASFSDVLFRIEDATNMQQCLHSVCCFLQHVDTVLNNEDKFCDFVFDQRKSLMLSPTPVKNSESVLKTFLDRLNALKCRDVKHILINEQYPLEDGLSFYLDKFSQLQKEILSLPNEKNKEISSTSTQKVVHITNLDMEATAISVDELVRVMNASCKQLKQCSSSILSEFSVTNHHHLYDIMNKQDEPKLDESLKGLLTCLRGNMFQPTLQCLKMLCKRVVVYLMDEDFASQSAAKVEAINAFGQLQSWYLAESECESDDDNDPTALDCV